MSDRLVPTGSVVVLTETFQQTMFSDKIEVGFQRSELS